MNTKAVIVAKNFFYTFSSNFITLAVATIVTLVVPRLIGVAEYGYWQLFLFYSTYVGVFHFGWSDGIYLKYGGEKYNDLDENLFYSQFIQLTLTQLFLGATLIMSANWWAEGPDRVFIFQMVAIDMVLMNIRYMFLHILQATNRIKKYSAIMIIDRIIFIGLIILLLSLGIRDYHLMIIADLFSKLISLIYSFTVCKNIVFNRISNFKLTLAETFDNIHVGIKLMLANLASKAIIGIVRFGIELSWDVEVFAKVSLSLSISQFLMVFIQGIGIIIYPILRRTKKSNLPYIYMLTRNFLMIFSFGFLIMYYPARVLLSMWLPQYSEALLYMSLLFPIVIYEGRIALLINTYLKTLRFEKQMLKVNVVTVILSLVLTVITTSVLSNLNLAILTILIGQVIRALIAEVYLSSKLNIYITKDIFLESILTLLFILTGWFIDSFLTTIIYSLGYVAYLIIKYKDLKFTYNGIKEFIKY